MHKHLNMIAQLLFITLYMIQFIQITFYMIAQIKLELSMKPIAF